MVDVTNLAGIIHDATNGYDGVAIEIYISGCTRNCDGCHNPQMQDFKYGERLNVSNLIDHIRSQEKWIDIISFLGGDLLCQSLIDASYLSYMVRQAFPDKKLWLFTGEVEQNLPKWCFEVFDVIKVGPYVESLRKPGYELASSNQKYIVKGVDY